MNISRSDVISYHVGGKVGLRLPRQLSSQQDLSIAYTPGVGQACKIISADRGYLYQISAKSNLVAVVTDGTAVLGFGDIGAAASIPVMEGKAVLFKSFAGVDAWPVPLENVRMNGKTGKTDVNKVIEAVAALSVMYGGINLEDIAAPACFEIEDRLQEMLDIPVFHDDQWGTAVITLAAVINYCHLSKKNMEELVLVINGAGAAGIRIADMLKEAGARNVTLCDSKGVLHTGRADLNEHKRRHAATTAKRTLAEALAGADVFIGVSVKDCVTGDMVRAMNEFPAVFAMANPDPEITPEKVAAALGSRAYVMATGRSDYPNQINNVLGFPYIFRGALDVRAAKITMAMKVAAAHALAGLARAGGVPDEVRRLYTGTDLDFGRQYLVPVPFDRRIKKMESSAVARAALAEGNSKYCDTKNYETAASEQELRGSVLRGLQYAAGKLFILCTAGTRTFRVPCAGEVAVEDTTAAPAKKILTVSIAEEPGTFLRFASLLAGQVKTEGAACLNREGQLNNLTGMAGWKWQ